MKRTVYWFGVAPAPGGNGFDVAVTMKRATLAGSGPENQSVCNTQLRDFLLRRLLVNAGQGNVDVAASGIGIGANLVGLLDQLVGLALIHAWQGDPQFDLDAEATVGGADTYHSFYGRILWHG